ncbi:hypothetical protein OIN60_02360 [Paenibacillus sp. P96]|uniref:Uncharacterized protein n=1 Tax=Paenibacillus zeirhizosphaerae TaxID=2987519 RepID=A0ABT9FLM9_9BACL|nr:hypothetical protein [Paenibacillus sp. P96]MDP4095635.1 hypothetical protein [Paenibacillus sp. P96]
MNHMDRQHAQQSGDILTAHAGLFAYQPVPLGTGFFHSLYDAGMIPMRNMTIREE